MKGRYRFFPSMLRVYELAKSLDKSEIHTLRNFAKTGLEGTDDVAYLVFFDVLRAQSSCDLSHIKSELRGKLNVTRLSDARCYLYHRMLDAIQASNRDEVGDAVNLLSQIKVLMFKGLHHHVSALYEKAMEFAEGTEDFETMLKLIRSQKLVTKRCMAIDAATTELFALSKKETEIQEKLVNLWAWEKLLDSTHSIRGLEKEARNDFFERISAEKLIVEEGPCLSSKANVVRLLIQDFLLSSKSSVDQRRIQLLKEVANVLLGHNALLNDAIFLERYLSALYNIALLGIFHSLEPEVEEAISKIEGLSAFRPDAEVLIFEKTAIIKVDGILNSMELEDGKATIRWAKNGLLAFGDRISPRHRASLLLGLSKYYFFRGRYGQVAKLLHSYLDEEPSKSKYHPSIMRWGYFLMAHYELGNTEVMLIYAKHALKFMKRHEIGSDVDRTFIAFFQSLAKKNVASKKRAEFTRFIKNILPQLMEEQNPYYTTSFPFAHWANCNALGHNFTKTVSVEMDGV